MTHEDIVRTLSEAADFLRRAHDSVRAGSDSAEGATLFRIMAREHELALRAAAHDFAPFSAPSPVFTSAPPAELDAPPTCDCDPDRAWEEREQ